MFLLKPSKLNDSKDSHKSEGSDDDERSGTAAAVGAGEPGATPRDVGPCTDSMWKSSSELFFRVLLHIVHCRTVRVSSGSSFSLVSMLSVVLSQVWTDLEQLS